jgi:hypothetical protein
MCQVPFKWLIMATNMVSVAHQKQPKLIKSKQFNIPRDGIIYR